MFVHLYNCEFRFLRFVPAILSLAIERNAIDSIELISNYVLLLLFVYRESDVIRRFTMNWTFFRILNFMNFELKINLNK